MPLPGTQPMNNLDYSIIIGGGLFVALGFYWGLIRQVLALVGLVVGIVMAGRLGPEVASWLSSFVTDPLLAGAFGFFGVLLLVSGIASLVASLLRFFVGLLFLGWLDHLLGAGLGLLQALLAATAIVMAMAIFPLPLWTAALEGSLLAQPLLGLSPLLASLLPLNF